MATKYTLHYLPVPARGEMIRVLFHYGDIEFVDKKYKFSEFPQIKADDAKFPTGLLPVLQIDDEWITESHAIIRHLGRELNLYGSTNKEKVIIDQVMDVLKNVEENCWRFFYFREGEDQANGIKNIYENLAPRAFKYIERLLKANNNGEGFLVGNSVTIGDIEIMIAIESILLEKNTSHRDFLDCYPLVKALNERVREIKNIKKYLHQRGPPVFTFN